MLKPASQDKIMGFLTISNSYTLWKKNPKKINIYKNVSWIFLNLMLELMFEQKYKWYNNKKNIKMVIFDV